jgi:uncharacterized protein YhdP
VLNFRLDIQDAGQLLERLGQAVRCAAARDMEGMVAWRGAPSAPTTRP